MWFEASDWGQSRRNLAERLQMVRIELFGVNGSPLVAKALQVSHRAWVRFERGTTIPAEVLLRFMELTATDPLWLLTGTGHRYLVGSRNQPRLASPDSPPASALN